MNLREKHLKEALHELDKIKQKNLQLANQRYQEIQQVIPEIAELRLELAQQTNSLIRQTISQPEKKDEFTAILEETQQRNATRITNLLLEHNYPTNYLEPIYNCNMCKDTGFLENNQACACLKRLFINKAYQQSNLSTTLAVQNFDTFLFEVYGTDVDPKHHISPRENMKDIYNTCYSFATNFGKHHDNLLLYGASGLGKTFLCNCIAKQVLDREFLVIYLSAPEFFGIFEKYHFHHGDVEIDYGFIESIYDCDLLIIDDLGTEVINSVTQSDIFQTINRRINNRKSTVISTNFTVSQLSKIYSERTVSRLLGEYTPLLFFGDDIRKQAYL